MKPGGSRWTSLAALLVFTLFALCLMLVLLTGAGVYRRLADRGDAGYTRQAAAQYIATRFHQGREPKLEDFGGCESLTFAEDFGGMVYFTRVYCCDGYLRELFSAEAAELAPEDGEKILPVEALDFSLEEDVLTVNVNGDIFYMARREGRQVPHGK